MKNTKKISVYIPEELYSKIKKYSDDNYLPISSIIITATNLYLNWTPKSIITQEPSTHQPKSPAPMFSSDEEKEKIRLESYKKYNIDPKTNKPIIDAN